MNLKIDMYMCAGPWDNDLVNQKEGQMTPIEVTRQDQFGHERTSVIRYDEARGEVFLAEIDPDFGCGSSCSVFGSEAAAIDRIEMPMD